MIVLTDRLVLFVLFSDYFSWRVE